MAREDRADFPPGHCPLTVEQLTAGTGNPIVVVDFLQLTSARPLAEVLSARGGGRPIYRIDPVTDLAHDDRYRPLESLADGYAGACMRNGLVRGELTVAGYCSAAALALLLAARLARLATVGAILIQPTWPNTRSICEHFRSFRADLGASVNQLPSHGTDTGLLPDTAADPNLILQQMHAILERDLRAMAMTHGLDLASPGLPELLARYRAWLGFALATREALAHPWPCDIHPQVLAGADGKPHMPWLDPASYRVVRLPVTEEELLTDPAFADSLLALAEPAAG